MLDFTIKESTWWSYRKQESGILNNQEEKENGSTLTTLINFGIIYSHGVTVCQGVIEIK